MRLGGQVFIEDITPEKWIKKLQEKNYRAAVFPIDHTASDEEILSYQKAAEAADIVIAEVGAWSNPISPDPVVREKAINYCKDQLRLADRIGANVCVNISGSRGNQWDAPHPDNFSEATFNLIVKTVQEIIDDVKPTNTFFALEMMPWALPDDTETYLELMKAIDRKEFAVHFDPVNMLNSPRKVYRNRELIEEFFEKLGPYTKTAHAKDIALGTELTTHLSEVIPGEGILDYDAFLLGMDKLGPEIPLMMEHLDTEAEYDKATAYIRKKAEQLGIQL
ncbi:sugar phosphate isomerase/epimerase family protein [Amphibacillus xylanus]|uniref:Xylose isomerase-like TIM barrel domain-containing protein n=1 Tax=Amphibacillus xylanus (strain ATCC 51415 / DSM 6626 / JCM 7361 / LMG 17667 / NBRC 15112 / Ep01) TaxID=698758 RepID=K0IZB3_AMPXN|nr:TIM barrel protein [Amphibacillus xylanus]BAM47890.1 hypothetical protein AXY_17580 [Amphibacillus xylanus NBRC 15112]